MNTRGIADALIWVPKILIMAAIVSVIVIFVQTQTPQTSDTFKLHNEIAITKLLYNDLTYVSPAGRTHPLIIDPAKLDRISLQLRNAEAEITIEQDTDVIKRYITNQEEFDVMKTLAWSDKYDIEERTYYILLKRDTLIPARLRISIAYET